MNLMLEKPWEQSGSLSSTKAKEECICQWLTPCWEQKGFGQQFRGVDGKYRFGIASTRADKWKSWYLARWTWSSLFFIWGNTEPQCLSFSAHSEVLPGISSETCFEIHLQQHRNCPWQSWSQWQELSMADCRCSLGFGEPFKSGSRLFGQAEWYTILWVQHCSFLWWLRIFLR